MKRNVVLYAIFCVLVLALCAVVVASPANAATVVDSGTCGDNLTWTLDSEGTLTISGSGAMEDYGMAKAPWYQKQITAVVIEPGVTTIGDYAFFEWYGATGGVTSVVISDSVTTIGRSAFQNCDALTSIMIPDTVTTIKDNAFSSCTGLTSITIPNSITDIRIGVFSGCGSLTSVTIPDSVTTIWDSAFSSCSGLASVTIPESVTQIGYSAFRGCSSLTAVTIPNGASIGYAAFRDCTKLASVNIPHGKKSISGEAFYGCSELTSIIIPDSVEVIYWQAFAYCTKLASVVIPDSVTTIEIGVFEGCSALTSVVIPDSVITIGASQWNGCSSLITAGPIGSGCNIEFGWTESIPDYAFSNYNNLDYICLPATVTEVGSNAFRDYTGIIAINAYQPEEPVELDWLPEGAEVVWKNPGNPFADALPGTYYEDAAVWAYKEGLVKGTSTTSAVLNPNGILTRAEVVTLLWRSQGSPEPATTVNPFVDVVAGSWYEKAVLWAVENNIVNGTSATTFSPAVECDGTMAVTLLWRTEGRPAPVGAPTAGYPSWCAAAITWADEHSLFDGVCDDPSDPSARAHIITYLYRYALMGE